MVLWYMPMVRPRRSGRVISVKYIGQTVEIKPMPTPTRNRPEISSERSPNAVKADSKEPPINTSDPIFIADVRPTLSVIGPAMSAPNRAPKRAVEVTMPATPTLKPNCAVKPTNAAAMIPVPYPKSEPPNMPMIGEMKVEPWISLAAAALTRNTRSLTYRTGRRGSSSYRWPKTPPLPAAGACVRSVALTQPLDRRVRYLLHMPNS